MRFVGILREVQLGFVPASLAPGEAVGIGAKLDRADLGDTAPRFARLPRGIGQDSFLDGYA
jgi:hypothetical protein